ncbi:glycosyltransferase [Candidatus Woesearchaeota archaeon]|nr:glycosyltransferase [Candidatus Woesearchaeota archaeon]
MKVHFISIVIPAFNAEKTIANCIYSLINQSYQKNKYEIIVVDNGSTDNTLNILKRFENRIKILKERKKGAYYARNSGIKSAKGQIVAFTDSDCVAGRKWLFYLNKSFQNKNAKIVGGKTRSLLLNNSFQKYCDRFCNTQDISFSCKAPYFGAGNMAIRKSVLDKVGLFNESLKSGADVDICHRIIKSKKDVCYEPRAIINHYYPNSLISFIKKYYKYGKWNKIRNKNVRVMDEIQVHGYTYAKFFKNHGLFFLFFRLLQDLSYNLGSYVGSKKAAAMQNL